MSEWLRMIFYGIYGWSFKSILICIVLSVAACTMLNIFAPKSISKVIYLLMFITATIVIIFFTIINRSSSVECTTRLVPFSSFKNAGYGAYQSMWLNAFFFLPFGLSLPNILPQKIKHKTMTAIITAASFSVCIEAVQFFFQLGLCETDDVIMNTLGAAIGTVSFFISERKNQIR